MVTLRPLSYGLVVARRRSLHTEIPFSIRPSVGRQLALQPMQLACGRIHESGMVHFVFAIIPFITWEMALWILHFIVPIAVETMPFIYCLIRYVLGKFLIEGVIVTCGHRLARSIVFFPKVLHFCILLIKLAVLRIVPPDYLLAVFSSSDWQPVSPADGAEMEQAILAAKATGAYVSIPSLGRVTVIKIQAA